MSHVRFSVEGVTIRHVFWEPFDDDGGPD